MIDKKLDNQKSPTEQLTPESELTTPEIFDDKEQEQIPTEKTNESKTSLEKDTPKIVPIKVRKVIPPIPQVQDEVAIKIEKILEIGIAEEYSKLSPIAKQEFKIKGEETTAKIRELLLSTHVKVKKIFYLIIEWLRILPGMNKFFIEQEAKIKTDLILELHKKQTEKDINKIL